MFKKLTQIATAWYNYANADAYIKMVMQKRLAICDECDEKVQLNPLGRIFVQLINEEGSTFQCGRCGCPLAGKTAGLSEECPLKKWGPAGGEQSYF